MQQLTKKLNEASKCTITYDGCLMGEEEFTDSVVSIASSRFRKVDILHQVTDLYKRISSTNN